MAVLISAVITAVGSAAVPEALVFLESTTYPGTIDDVVRPVLDASGSVAGLAFNLAFSPERFDPGGQEFGPQNTAT